MKKNNIAYVASAPFVEQILQILLEIPSIQVVGVWTKVPKPRGRGMKIAPSKLMEYCERMDIPLFPVQTVNSLECAQQWNQLYLDAAVVVGHGEVIHRGVYEIPTCGTFNIHFSLLPKYRGASPIQSVILEGDAISGVTLQKIDDRCDTGDIVMQQSFDIRGDDAKQVLQKSIVACKDLLTHWADQLGSRQMCARPQLHHLASTCSKISKGQGRIFPEDLVETVDKKYRAFVGWPGVFVITVDKKRIQLLSISSDSSDISHPDRVGHLIYDVEKVGLYVALSNGSLRIHTLQLEGKSPLSDRDFINGWNHRFPIRICGELI